MRAAAAAACLVVLCGCGMPKVGWFDREPVPEEFAYYIDKDQPDKHYIVKKPHPTETVRHAVTFHPESDQEMLKGLMSLKAGIRYLAADGGSLYLTGIHDPDNQTFKLQSWYILTPFTEARFEEGRARPRMIRRHSLRPDDFYEPVALNLDELQRLRAEREAEDWGGVGKPPKGEDFRFEQ
jgi:hypothetical protein